jgi:tRNA U38,U39,U40 pseudouridine synthase TruA
LETEVQKTNTNWKMIIHNTYPHGSLCFQFQAAAADTSAHNKTKPNQVEEDEAKEAHLTSSVAISGANNGKDPSIPSGLASRRHYYYWPHKRQYQQQSHHTTGKELTTHHPSSLSLSLSLSLSPCFPHSATLSSHISSLLWFLACFVGVQGDIDLCGSKN